MSRRWYRHAEQVVFVGWEPLDQAFSVNVVALCGLCGGSGEQDGSDEICIGCNGEGIAVGVHSPSERKAGLTLDEVDGELNRLGLPFPDFVRSDLEEDQRTNAAAISREYELE